MTKSQFRKFLLVYALITLVMGAIVGYCGYKKEQNMPNIHEKLMSDTLFSKGAASAFDSVSSLKQASNIVNATAIILGLVSWVGLFMIWAPSRIIFIFSLITTYAIAPVFNIKLVQAFESEQISNVTEVMQLNAFESPDQIMLAVSAFINGALYVMLATNLTKHLFEKNHEI